MPVQVGWRRRTLNQGNGRGRALVVGLEGGQDHARIAERRGALSPGGSRTGGCSDGHEWVQGGRTGCYLGLAAVLLNMFVEQTGREEGGNVFFFLERETRRESKAVVEQVGQDSRSGRCWAPGLDFHNVSVIRAVDGLRHGPVYAWRHV